jgi:8-amino-7-oxononanoate synthase
LSRCGDRCRLCHIHIVRLIDGEPGALPAAYSGIAGLMRVGLWDQVIDEIDGRRIRIGSRWLVDFGSCNYLGLDLDPRVMSAIEPSVRQWGTHPSWSRMLGSPRLFAQIEQRLADLLGAPDTLLLPTISQIHLSVIPVLAGTGAIFLDSRAHRTIYDGCVQARARGASLRRFRTNDVEHLGQLLSAAAPAGPKLVCIDGVNSMTGNTPDLSAFASVCREYDALLYIDDAHGFGVLGERRPDEMSPYGVRGNAVVRHFGETYDNVVLVGGLSKAYSSLAAFVACSSGIKWLLKVTAAPYLYSGPSPTASLATVLAGLDVNATDGEDLRAALYRMTARVLQHVRGLGLFTPNTSGFPLFELLLTDPADLHDVGWCLRDLGMYAVLAPYPGVPRDQVGFRIQVTAAHTDEQIGQLLDALTQVTARFSFRRAAEMPE